MRATIGKAQLLMRQRFKQFSGLVDNCEFGTGLKPTTCDDLQGFWDMIYFQVSTTSEYHKYTTYILPAMHTPLPRMCSVNR